MIPARSPLRPAPDLSLLKSEVKNAELLGFAATVLRPPERIKAQTNLTRLLEVLSTPAH
jgi:hypothetical protein